MGQNKTQNGITLSLFRRRIKEKLYLESDDLYPPGEDSARHSCNYRSNLESVQQVPITTGWPEAMWIQSLPKAFIYMTGASGIEPQFPKSWVPRLNRSATCSKLHYYDKNRLNEKEVVQRFLTLKTDLAK